MSITKEKKDENLIQLVNLAVEKNNIFLLEFFTENPGRRDSGEILNVRIMENGPYEGVQDFDKRVKRMGPATIEHMGDAVYEKATNKATNELDLALINEIITDPVENQASETAEISLEEIEDVMTSFNNYFSELGSILVRKNCTSKDKFQLAEELSNNFRFDSDFFQGMASEFAIAREVNQKEADLVRFNTLKQFFLVFNLSKKERKQFIEKDHKLKELFLSIDNIINQITNLEEILPGNGMTSNQLFEASFAGVENRFDTVGSIILRENYCPLVDASMTLLGYHLLQLNSLLSSASIPLETFLPFFDDLIKAVSNCDTEGLTSCDLVSFKYVNVGRIGTGKLVPLKSKSANFSLSGGVLEGLVKSLDGLFKSGKTPKGFIDFIKKLFNDGVFKTLMNSVFSGAIAEKLIAYLIKKIGIELTALGSGVLATGVTILVANVAISILIIQSTIEGITRKLRGAFLICAKFKIVVCKKYALGVLRSVVHEVNLKITPRNINEAGGMTGIFTTVWTSQSLGIFMQEFLKYSILISEFENVRRKLKESPKSQELKNKEAAYIRLINDMKASKAQKAYDRLRLKTKKIACAAARADLKKLPKISGFESC